MMPGVSIRTQLFLLIAAVALPLMALSAYNQYRDYTELQRAAVGSARDLAQITAVQATRMVRDAQTLLAAIAQRPRVLALDPKSCDPLFRDFQDLYPRFANLLTADAAGRLVCSAAQPAPGRTAISPEHWLRETLRSGKPLLSAPTRSGITGGWVVVLAHPLRDQRGSVVGGVALPIDLLRFRPFAEELTLAPETAVRILSADGTVLASLREPEAWIGRNVRGEEIVATVLERKQGEMRAVGIDGIERMFSFLPIAGTDWYAHAGIPVGAALAGANRRALQLAAVAALILLLAAVLAASAFRGISRPIRAIEETAKKIAGGDRDARFRAEGPAEIARLVQQFNGTLDALAEDERRRRKSEGRLAEVIGTVAEGIVSVDESQRIVLFNPAAEKMFGRTAADMIGRPLGTLVPERFRARHEEHLRDFAATGESARSMGRYGMISGLRADGGEFPMEATISQFGASPDKLLTVILRDVTERVRAEEALRQRTEQLHLLTYRLIETEENARRLLARELHDSIGQNVSALNLNLGIVRSELPPESARKIGARLDDCESLLHATGQLVRDVMAELRPPGLEELGLFTALGAHAREAAARAGVAATVRGGEAAPRLPPTVEITLFRIAQEALINIAKHAGATEITIELEPGPDEVILAIGDNGRGFDVNAATGRIRTSLGMINMRERAESIGARLEVVSAPGRGTRVIVVVPRAARA